MTVSQLQSEDLPLTFDWSAWLAKMGSDTIVSSTWEAGDGSNIELHDASVDTDNRLATVWIRGGNPGLHTIVNTIVASGSPPPNGSEKFLIQILG